MDENVLQVRDLRVWFPVRSRLSDLWARREKTFIRAVDGITFALDKAETLALVGESGSGKTTVARALMCLLKEAEGEIRIQGRSILGGNLSEPKRRRYGVQMVFQDPFDAMNPRETIFKIVSEPLSIHKRQSDHKERKRLVADVLSDVGLHPPEDFMHRYPHELSGGQRQRVLIAGALIMDPDLIIADEPVSMLDASLKVEILNLLVALRKKRSLAYLIITHDLALTRYVADRIAIMYLGSILETGPTKEVLHRPFHPYTKALVKVVPTLDRVWEEKPVLSGEIPHPSNIPAGCRFHPRCPNALEICARNAPAMREIEDNRMVACHVA